MIAGMPDLSLRRFEDRLAAHRPVHIDEPGLARSAVATVLRWGGGAPEVLLMKRAERPGDGWSGHVSFPGGREAAGDADLRATAVRETREEVGLDLEASARLLGRLDTIRAVARGRIRPLTITPFVFEQTADAPLVLGDEAAAAFWLPLERVASGELADQYEYSQPSGPLRLPCWRYDGQVIWGLTYQMLAHLIEVVADVAIPNWSRTS